MEAGRNSHTDFDDTVSTTHNSLTKGFETASYESDNALPTSSTIRYHPGQGLRDENSQVKGAPAPPPVGAHVKITAGRRENFLGKYLGLGKEEAAIIELLNGEIRVVPLQHIRVLKGNLRLSYKIHNSCYLCQNNFFEAKLNL